ncbi:MAG: hypothetical protein H0X63_00145, partial [Flavobacteriales bacterium]|nr:hypothetical protein [Flavobacteriales bacterium]
MLGITENEIVIEIVLSDSIINSLEWIPKSNQIILHIWFDIIDENGLEAEYEFDVDFD